MSKEENKVEYTELNMKTYTGTKTLKAIPTTKGWYNNYRGWEMPEDEDPDEAIYLVEYPVEEDTVPNHDNHKGYISMSPKTVFEKYYSEGDGSEAENESEEPKTWQDRLKIERDELSQKIEKLDVAINMKKVPREEVSILTKQVHSMRKYLQILNERSGKLK